MRNLKKFLAVIVTVAMLASFAIPVFAEEDTLTDAEVIETLGMIKGDGDGVTDEYLASAVTRMQAAIMFLRLQGLEDEALAYEGTDNFTDADEVWEGGQAILAYLLANPDLGWQGVVAGETFEPLSTIDAQSYYKVMLEALGYKQGVDFEWAEVFEFAADLGLSAVADVEEFSVTDLATATVEALNATVKDSESTLFEALVEDGVIDEDDAVAAGLLEGEPDELAVKDAIALNLIQVEVEFNMDLTDEAIAEKIEDEDNYDFEDSDGKDLRGVNKGKIEVEDVKIDGNTAVLKLNEAAKNQSKGVLVVKKAITGTKEKLDLEFEDLEFPTVESAEVIGQNYIKVVYSEPMNVDVSDHRSNFTVESDDGKTTYRVSNLTLAKSNTEVTVEVRQDLEDGDEIVLKTSNKIKDYAGFSAPKETFELTVEEDDSEIEVVDFRKATEESVTLIMNKDVMLENEDLTAGDEDDDEEEVDEFYHTNSKNVAHYVEIDGNEIKIMFSKDNELPTGTAYIYIDGEALVDYWGNENDSTIRTKIEVSEDDVAPTVEKVKADDARTITVTFDKKLDDDSAEDEDNYVILKANGSESDVEVRRAIYDDDDKVELRLNGTLSAGKYSLEISDVEDTRGNVMKTVTEDFDVDSTPIDLRLSSAGGDLEITTYVDNADYDDDYGEGKDTEYTILVDYDRQMICDGSRYAIDNLDNYVVAVADDKSYTLTDLDDEDDYYVSISVDEDEEVAEITVEIDRAEKDHELTSITIARVADSTETLSVQLASAAIGLSPGLPSATPVVVKSVKATGNKTIKVEFEHDLDYVCDDDFELYGITVDASNKIVTKVPLSDIIKSVSQGDDDEVIIGLDEKLNADATYTKATVDYIVCLTIVAGAESETEFEQTLQALDVGAVGDTAAALACAKDKIVPEFDEDAGDNEEGYYVEKTGTDYITTLYFNEDLDDAKTAFYSTFVVKNDDGKEYEYTTGALSGRQFSLEIDGDTIILTTLISEGDEIDVTVTENAELVDLSGNKVEEFSVFVDASRANLTADQASVATAEALIADEIALAATDTNLLDVLNAIDGMVATGVTLDVKAAVTGTNAAIAADGVVTNPNSDEGEAAEDLTVIITIDKGAATTVEKEIEVTVPATAQG